jgi:hypothetical protein
MRPSDGKRGTETAKDFDSISEWPQNHKPELIHTIQRSLMEAAEHKVGGLSEISSQVLKEQGRTRGVQGTRQHLLRQTIWGYRFMIIKT